MELNADFTRKVVVTDTENPWRASPSAGVERKMLDRVGDEVARATTIVRFAPGSHFSAHTHDGGEEYIVLDGVFQDEEGDFPAGSYVRNPPTSQHTPRSEPGATIFVKLWQFDPADREHVHIDMNEVDLDPDPARSGVDWATLYKAAREHVTLEQWAPDAAHVLQAPDGAEVLVLQGELTEGETPLGPRDWLRVPPGEHVALAAGAGGARLWIKTGHLAQVVAD